MHVSTMLPTRDLHTHTSWTIRRWRECAHLITHTHTYSVYLLMDVHNWIRLKCYPWRTLFIGELIRWTHWCRVMLWCVNEWDHLFREVCLLLDTRPTNLRFCQLQLVSVTNQLKYNDSLSSEFNSWAPDERRVISEQAACAQWLVSDMPQSSPMGEIIL